MSKSLVFRHFLTISAIDKRANPPFETTVRKPASFSFTPYNNSGERPDLRYEDFRANDPIEVG